MADETEKGQLQERILALEEALSELARRVEFLEGHTHPSLREGMPQASGYYTGPPAPNQTNKAR